MKRLHSAASLSEPSARTPELDSKQGCFYSVIPEDALCCPQQIRMVIYIMGLLMGCVLVCV